VAINIQTSKAYAKPKKSGEKGGNGGGGGGGRPGQARTGPKPGIGERLGGFGKKVRGFVRV
jgi:hypothetical protein